VNWKTPVDNCSDNYHLSFSHYSTSFARHKVFGTPMRPLERQLRTEDNNDHHIFVNGHGLTFNVVPEGIDVETQRTTTSRFLGGTLGQRQFEFQQSKIGEVERRLGHYRANRLRLNNHSLFPNGVLGFRLALPRGPFQTEFWHFAVVEADAPEELRIARSAASGGNNGASGLNEQDDMDNWGQVTMASKLVMGRRYPAVLSMGVGHSGRNEEWPGDLSERYISENNQRGYYKRWEEFMNADSWADIHVDPITVNFEGTATMHS
jgi:hypothetical protein